MSGGGAWDPDAALGPLAEGTPAGLALLLRDHGAAVDRALRARPGAPSRATVLSTVVDRCARGDGPDGDLRSYVLGVALDASAGPEGSPLDRAVRAHLAALSPAERSLLWYAHVERDRRALDRAELATADLRTALADATGSAPRRGALGVTLARARFGEAGVAYARPAPLARLAAWWPAGGPSGVEWVGLALLALGLVAAIGALAGAANLALGALGR